MSNWIWILALATAYDMWYVTYDIWHMICDICVLPNRV